MSFSRMRWLAFTAVIGLVACGGADETASNASARSESGLTSAAVLSDAATEKTGFNSADAVVQSDFTQKSGAASTDPVVRVPINRKSDDKAVTRIDLGAPTQTQLEQRIQNNKKSATGLSAKAYRIGFSRTVAASSATKSFQQLLNWTTTDTGSLRGSLTISSTGAAGIRLGLLVQSLPDDAVLRVYASGGPDAEQTTGNHINTMIAANVKADGDSQAARTYWMPATLSDTAVLEVELPAGTDTSTVSLSMPKIMHQVETATKAALAQIESKSSCPNLTPDATCTTPLPPAANATASIDFTDGAFDYVCTGTLVSNRDAIQQGYFLTANHCIGTQTVASTIVSWWFYRSSACNSGVVSSNTVPLSGGAMLLFNRSEASSSLRNPTGTDTAFMDLVGAPPAGAVHAGWAFQRYGINTATDYVGWHNPGGEVMRRSDGRLTNYLNYLGNDQGVISTDASYPMYEVDWTTGITEGGSSGSGLFADGASNNPKIIGQLWGGFSGCGAGPDDGDPNGRDYYGRFDIAYENGLINWLNPGYRMVFRFYNTRNGAHFFSANVDERDATRANNTALTYEAPVFMVAPAAGTGLSPVYRFYNRRTGVHFYTIDEGEKATVQANTATYTFEGVGWYARKANAPASGTVEVYRFFRRSAGTHLYTTSVAERDNIIATLGQFYNYEGVAYLAWPVN